MSNGELGRVIGEEKRCLGIFQHKSKAVGGVGRIKRKVGGTGFEDGKNTNDEVEGAFEADADDAVGANALFLQEVGQLVGLLGELLVGEGMGAEGNGRCLWRTCRLAVYQFVDTSQIRIFFVGFIPMVGWQIHHRPLLLVGNRE